MFADRVPDLTAVAVRQLLDAGYALTGKTNLYEFAFGTTSENPHFGPVPNPRHPGRSAGGSSGGSAAAVAAGLADLALGTDSGGSVRIPAACCGVVGFKPSYGLVSLEGCWPLAPTYDHAGVIAPSVRACADALAVLAPAFEPVHLDSTDGLTIGIAWLEEADPGVHARVAAAAQAFRGRHPIRLEELPRATFAEFAREAADVHRALFAESGDLYGPDVARKITACLAVTDAEYEEARRARAAYGAALLAGLAAVDLVLTPTMPCVAPDAGLTDRELRGRLARFTGGFNAVGAPALALPCGPAEDGLPASVQLAGPPGADALVLAAGELLEASLAV